MFFVFVYFLNCGAICVGDGRIMDNAEMVYEKAQDFYGNVRQAVKCIEEMSELTKVLTKMICEGVITHNEINFNENPINSSERRHLIEEIVDVALMLEQIKFMFDIDNNEIKCETKIKVDRLLKRIGVSKFD